MSRLAVHLDVLSELDRSLETAAFKTLQLASRAQRAAADPALLAAAPLDPLGVARSVGRIEAAVVGPGGLLASAAALGADAVAVTTAGASYAAADGLVGTAAGVAGQLRMAAITAAALSARLADQTLASLAPCAEDGIRRGDRFALQFVGMPRPVADVIAAVDRDALGAPLRMLAARVPDGPGSAIAVGLPGAAGRDAPAVNLGDYLAGVDQLCDGQGHIALDSIQGPTPRYVVLLPGIASLGPTPYPQDLAGAAVAEELVDSAYGRGVRQALDAAAVPIGASVMLIGHSQGGVVAMNLAGDRRSTAAGSRSRMWSSPGRRSAPSRLRPARPPGCSRWRTAPTWSPTWISTGRPCR